MSGLWLAFWIGLGGIALVVLVEWLVLRKPKPRDDGTASQED